MATNLSERRGCGYRGAGDPYLVVPTSPFGRPIEHFLVCYPIRPAFVIPAQGQMPFVKDGVVHLLDWVGEMHYPHVTDWLEEARYLGVSRKVNLQQLAKHALAAPDDTILEALTPESRLYVAHRRAGIMNIDEYEIGHLRCPRNKAGHPTIAPSKNRAPICTLSYWLDLDEGEQLEPGDNSPFRTPVIRTLPCGMSYRGWLRPEGIAPVYVPAVFASFPIHHFELVRGQYGEHLSKRDQLANLRLNLPVIEVDE